MTPCKRIVASILLGTVFTTMSATVTTAQSVERAIREHNAAIRRQEVAERRQKAREAREAQRLAAAQKRRQAQAARKLDQASLQELLVGHTVYETPHTRRHQRVVSYYSPDGMVYIRPPQQRSIVQAPYAFRNDQVCLTWQRERTVCHAFQVTGPDTYGRLTEKGRLISTMQIAEADTEQLVTAWQNTPKPTPEQQRQRQAQQEILAALFLGAILSAATGGSGGGAAPDNNHPCLQNPHASGCQTPSYSSPAPQPAPVPPVGSLYGTGPGGSFYGNQ